MEGLSWIAHEGYDEVSLVGILPSGDEVVRLTLGRESLASLVSAATAALRVVRLVDWPVEAHGVPYPADGWDGCRADSPAWEGC